MNATWWENPDTGSLFLRIPGSDDLAAEGGYRMVRAGRTQWVVTDHIHRAGQTGALVPVVVTVERG